MLRAPKKTLHLPSNYEYQHDPPSGPSSSQDSSAESSEPRRMPGPDVEPYLVGLPDESSQRASLSSGEQTERPRCHHYQKLVRDGGRRKRAARLRPSSIRPQEMSHRSVIANAHNETAITNSTPAQTPVLTSLSTDVSSVYQPTPPDIIGRFGENANGDSEHGFESRVLLESTGATPTHPGVAGQPRSSESRDCGESYPSSRANSAPVLGFIPHYSHGPLPLSIHDQIRPSHVFDLEQAPDLIHHNDKPGKSIATAAVPTKAIRKPEPKFKKVDTTVHAKEKNTVTPGQKRKNKNIDENVKVKAPRVRPAPKPEIPVDPPIFENVNTRLDREGAEHRIMLREYMVRFQAVLSISDRSLPPLDEFDRPLSEASVRTFVGAMLDLIKEELELSEGIGEVLELLTQHREELRHYGDLARFANTFKVLAKPLALKRPPSLVPLTKAAAQTQAVREMLEVDEVTEEMEVRTTRRSAALGPIPPQHEVVRMLLALANRTLSTPKIRRDLGWEAPENEARRVHARHVKKENERWDKIRKKLVDAKAGLKDPAAIKANEEETAKEAKEHMMQFSLATVNLRAALGQRAIRLESLGSDMDGRVYWCLRYRPIDENAQTPGAWASGLLVWGIGVPRKPDAVVDEDGLPVSVERWCHFGRSSEVRQLAKWIGYRSRKAVEAAAKLKTPSKTKSVPSSAGASKIAKVTSWGSETTPTKQATHMGTPSRLSPATSKEVAANTTPCGPTRMTPRSVVQTPTKPATPRSAARPRLTLEVVIPLRPRDPNGATLTCIDRDLAREDDDDDDDQYDNDVDAQSDPELSELDSDSDNDIDENWGQERRELLDQLAPEGYRPLIGTIRDEAEELVGKLTEVADWLEVLEWKGLGEI